MWGDRRVAFAFAIALVADGLPWARVLQVVLLGSRRDGADQAPDPAGFEVVVEVRALVPGRLVESPSEWGVAPSGPRMAL